LASMPLRRLKQRQNHWKRCLSGPIVPSSGNIGEAEAVVQTFLDMTSITFSDLS
jgi:hypothetical protein